MVIPFLLFRKTPLLSCNHSRPSSSDTLALSRLLPCQRNPTSLSDKTPNGSSHSTPSISTCCPKAGIDLHVICQTRSFLVWWEQCRPTPLRRQTTLYTLSVESGTPPERISLIPTLLHPQTYLWWYYIFVGSIVRVSVMQVVITTPC